jgi:pimeloyl-ACP methyl ester carboxylesterase
MASAEDMLFPHLDRLPPLRGDQRIERLAYDPAAKYAAIARFSADLPGEGGGPPAPGVVLAGDRPAVGFIDAPGCQVFIRAYGDRAKPAVILLHDGPGTGLMLEPLALALQAEAYVIAPDLPGTGNSAAPAPEREILGAAGDAVGAIADALGLDRFILAATGCGCATAVRFAQGGGARITALVLDDPPSLGVAEVDAIAPELPLTPEGGHWLKAWLMLRDGQIYRPWFDGRVSAQRTDQGNFDADWLHDQTVALMTSRETYHRLPRAAFGFDIAAALSAVSAPVHIAGAGGFAALIAETLHSDGNKS